MCSTIDIIFLYNASYMMHVSPVCGPTLESLYNTCTCTGCRVYLLQGTNVHCVLTSWSMVKACSSLLKFVASCIGNKPGNLPGKL